MESASGRVIELPAGSLFPQPQLLDPFVLEEADGRAFDLAQLKGHWTLLFAGYRQCPDVCPTTLASLGRIFRELGASANTFAVVFLTLEPEVDEREDLLDFVHGFHRDFRAITGSRSSIEAFASRLRISFERGTGEQDKDRIISHLSRILLINPQGELAGSFPPGQDEALIKASLLRLMRR
jgi:protein SCO1/2